MSAVERKLNWDDVQELAAGLMLSHSDVDPLTLRFVDLQHWSVELELFEGDAQKATPDVLEAIQKAWYVLYLRGLSH